MNKLIKREFKPLALLVVFSFFVSLHIEAKESKVTCEKLSEKFNSYLEKKDAEKSKELEYQVFRIASKENTSSSEKLQCLLLTSKMRKNWNKAFLSKDESSVLSLKTIKEEFEAASREGLMKVQKALIDSAIDFSADPRVEPAKQKEYLDLAVKLERKRS